MADSQERKFVFCVCCQTTYTGSTEPGARKEAAAGDTGGRKSSQPDAVHVPLKPVQHQPYRQASWDKGRVNLSKPTMGNLLSFPSSGNKVHNIPLVISDKAHEFCINLLDDDDGSKFREIEAKHKNSYQGMNSETLERWLQGGGKQPVVWDVLVATLREVDMMVLASEIELSVLKWKKKDKTTSLPSRLPSKV
jgi:hypothetical protein